MRRIPESCLVSKNGELCWFAGDDLHRDNGPAVLCHDGYELWYRHGELHRDNGPAYIKPNGAGRWYLNGRLYNDRHLYQADAGLTDRQMSELANKFGDIR